MTTLFAWAVPAWSSGSPVDHTWITTFDNQSSHFPDAQAVADAAEQYWFCWGGYHAAGGVPGNATGSLGRRNGRATLSKCLVGSNVDSNDSTAAKGTIFVYGVDGVCHQLANQVLFGTEKPPLTVKGARGYHASAFLYGTYGHQFAAWKAKIHSCGAQLVAAGAAESVGMRELPDDFEEHARNVLADQPELLQRLLNLKTEVQLFNARTAPGYEPPAADLLNKRNQHLLDQAAILLGSDRFRAVFGFDPADKIDLVDPTVAPRY